jgi:hypothetical protein
MRAHILLLSLATAPFVAAAAQGGAAAVKDPAQCAVADANRSPNSWSRERPTDPQGRPRTGCSPVAPNDPPPPPPPSTGGATIKGTVWNSVTWMGLSGWTVEISGPVNTSAVTNVDGVYNFSGLPEGTYTVCENLVSGWTQAFPTMSAACASGMGYVLTVSAGSVASFVDFGNQL